MAASEGSGAGRIRADVLRAATRVFSEKGFHGASMQDVADELGMRKASLYHHVRSKEDLLFEIHDELLGLLLDGAVAQAVKATTPAEKLRALIVVNTEIVGENLDAVNVLLRDRSAVGGARWSELVVRRNVFESIVVDVIREGIRIGDFADVDVELAAKAILSMPGWTSTWFRNDGPDSATALGHLYADVALAGMTGGSGNPTSATVPNEERE